MIALWDKINKDGEFTSYLYLRSFVIHVNKRR